MGGRSTAERFTGRASYYARYRPSYPRKLVDDLFKRGVLQQGGKVADLGSGTGIFTELLLERGLIVYAVEPNEDMRDIAEEQLGGRQGFVSVNGRAEKTGLPDHSVNAVTAAQAYHWFEPELTKRELRRILVPKGWIVLLWNRRQADRGGFQEEYERLVNEFSAEHAGIEKDKEDPERIFGHLPYQKLTYQNDQRLDIEGLKGMAASVSYLPAPGDSMNVELCRRLEALFVRYQHDGEVTLHLRTECRFGRLD